MTYKEYDFPADKNQWLKEHRNISFEEAIAAIENGDILDVVPHANPAKYPHQSMYILNINEYVYLVPFVRKSTTCAFLKTIFKSRKMKKQYRKAGRS
ncbi:MAG: toxin [Gammaproteobacteria bacterium]|nr:toxin [Gammaproteobacteria bacterium]